MAKLLFSFAKGKLSYKLWGRATNFECCTPEQLAPWTHLAVRLAMLTFKLTCSVLCGLSIIALLGLPGSFVALCGLPRLAATLDGRCSTVAGRVFRCSAQELPDLCCHFTPGFIAGIGSLGLLLRPRCVHGATRRNFIYSDDAVLLFSPC